MYKNLEAEMARKRITRNDISTILGVRYATVIEKLNGKYDFKLKEAFVIKEEMFPDLSIEYLFEKETPKLSNRKEVN